MTFHIKYSDLNFQDKTAQAAIEQGGGKNLHGIFADDPEMEKYLSRESVLLSPQTVQDPEARRKVLEGLSYGPKILRAVILPDKETNHPGDFGGCVDFLPSEPLSAGVANKISLFNDHIDKIIRLATTDERKKHYEWEGGKADRLLDHLGFIIQDNFRGSDMGSIIAHSSDDEVFVIENEAADLNQKQVIHKNGVNIHGCLRFSSKGDKLISQLTSLYKKIRDSGKVPKDYSFQMEYGWNGHDLKIFQLRLFRRKDAKADFEINRYDFDYYTPFKYSVYGKTDERGIEIPITNLKQFAGITKENKAAYCYTDGMGEHRESPPLEITPTNMELFWFFADGSSPCNTDQFYDNNHLAHGAYRYLMKAPLALALRPGYLDDPISGIFLDCAEDDTPLKIKYVSNGVQAGIKLLK